MHSSPNTPNAPWDDPTDEPLGALRHNRPPSLWDSRPLLDESSAGVERIVRAPLVSAIDGIQMPAPSVWSQGRDQNNREQPQDAACADPADPFAAQTSTRKPMEMVVGPATSPSELALRRAMHEQLLRRAQGPATPAAPAPEPVMEGTSPLGFATFLFVVVWVVAFCALALSQGR